MPAASAATTTDASTTSCLRRIRGRPLEAPRPAFEPAGPTRRERGPWRPLGAMLGPASALRRLTDPGRRRSGRGLDLQIAALLAAEVRGDQGRGAPRPRPSRDHGERQHRQSAPGYQPPADVTGPGEA